ncbi:uncharacterized protein METZ01_LOCUS317852, partial [marine metagenome]
DTPGGDGRRSDYDPVFHTHSAYHCRGFLEPDETEHI